MNETKAIRISTVKAVGDAVLAIGWVGGKRSRVDLGELLHRLKGLRPLRDSATFRRVRVGEGGHSVAWPGELDVGADRLWELALEQSGRQDALEFLRWRWRHGLSLTEAADVLGLSRRTVAYYANATHAVPRTVLLACKGWEAEQRAA